jgi:hypothetical protein
MGKVRAPQTSRRYLVRGAARKLRGGSRKVLIRLSAAAPAAARAFPALLLRLRHAPIWGWFGPPLQAVFQIAVIFAALTFVQQQETLTVRSVDHGTKVLKIASVGLSPLMVRVYAIRFEINNLVDAANHVQLNAEDPIAGISTRGFVLEGTTWWQPLTVDLKKSVGLTFTTWPREITPRQEGLYCLVIEARSPLSNRSTIEPLLTPELLFPASLFGPMSSNASMGGGYPKGLLAVERQVKSDCLALYDKVRGG